MSDSKNTDELDNYGVWIKNSADSAPSSEDAAASTDFSLDASLPDFSSLDAFDTVSADTDAAETDESVTETEATDAGGEEDISLDEFIAGGEFEDVAEGNRGYGQSEAPAEQTASGEESVSLDDFLDLDSLNDAPASEEAAPVATESEDSPLDIDLAFDDSADTLATETVEADVSEELAASAPSDDLAGTESIDLSEFGFDESGEPNAESTPTESAATEAPAPSEETVAESTATDASADTFDDMFNALDDGGSIDASAFFDDEPSETATESAPAPAAEPAASTSGEEEVDLSDFGFDDDSTASQGEVKDGTKAAGGQEDYEMTVTVDDDDASPAPAPVAETPQTVTAAPVASEQPVPQAETVSPAATAILSQIVGELNSLRSEIADLKNDFEAMRTKGIPEPVAENKTTAESAVDEAITENTESAGEETATDDAVSETTTEDVFADIPEIPVPEQAESDAGGFFDDNGEDETISLSTDELSNILNNADFQTETVEAETETVTEEPADTKEEIATEATEESETVVENETMAETEVTEEATEEPITEATTESVTEIADSASETATEDVFADIPEIPVPEQAESEAGGFFDDNGEDETISLSTDELSNILNNADFQTETVEDAGETPLAEENESVAETETVTEEPADTKEEIATEATEESETATDTETVVENETVAEADDFNFDAIEQSETQDLPEEISVPKVDDDAEAELPADAFPSTEGMEVIDLSEEQPLEIVDLSAEAEETTAEEAVAEEPQAEQPAEADTATEPTDTAESETQPTSAEPAAHADNEISGTLKQEIKSVLSYMDQLLENLPEEKITEFAQSEQFEAYKKLFKELGLA